MWARNRLLEKPAAPASNASADDAGHLGDLVGRGVLVLVRPLAHHVVPDRPVGDVARDVGGVAAAVEHVEVLGEGLPLAPRHAVGEGGAGDVLDALHHVDELLVVGRAHRREADAAVAEHDGGDAVGGRRLERVVPGDLAVVVGVEVEEAGRDERAVGVDLLAGGLVDRADGDDAAVVGSPTSPVNAAAPVPSTMVPPRITVSSTVVLLFVRVVVGERRVEHRQQERVERGEQVAGRRREEADDA